MRLPPAPANHEGPFESMNRHDLVLYHVRVQVHPARCPFQADDAGSIPVGRSSVSACRGYWTKNNALWHPFASSLNNPATETCHRYLPCRFSEVRERLSRATNETRCVVGAGGSYTGLTCVRDPQSRSSRADESQVRQGDGRTGLALVWDDLRPRSVSGSSVHGTPWMDEDEVT